MGRVKKENRNVVENSIKCEICEKSFSTKQIKSKHISKVHGGSFESKRGLKRHIENQGQRNYKCDACGKSFTKSGSLKKSYQDYS